MSTPPKPGKGLSVRVDEPLYDDLATMMRTGMTASDAVKHAVAIIAGAYRNAWEMGVVTEGCKPDIAHCGVVPDQPRHTPRPASHGPRHPRHTPPPARPTPTPPGE